MIFVRIYNINTPIPTMNNVQNVIKQPPAGYRELAVGETILETDTYLDLGGKHALRSSCPIARGFVGLPYNKGFTHLPTFRKLDRIWRRLEVGEVIREGDKYNAKSNATNTDLELAREENSGWINAEMYDFGRKVKPYDATFFYRRVEAPAPQKPQVLTAPERVPADAEPGVCPGAGFRFVQVGEALAATDYVVFERGMGWRLGTHLQRAAKVSARLDGPYPYGYYIRALAADPAPRAPACPAASKSVTPVDPGAGYRLLQRGEKVQAGDEYHLNVSYQKWSPVGASCAGQLADAWLNQNPNFVWRRKTGAPKPVKVGRPFTVPPGYRELNDGETVFASDYMLAKGTWVPRANTRRVGRAYTKGTAFVTIRSTVDSSKVPAGFRLLGPSEFLVAGDKYLLPDGGTQSIHSNLGKTWASAEKYLMDWLGVIRPVPAPEPEPSFSSMLKPFQGPVVCGHIERIDGRRSVIVDRNASGAVRITINGLLGTRVISGSKEMADALQTCLSETS